MPRPVPKDEPKDPSGQGPDPPARRIAPTASKRAAREGLEGSDHIDDSTTRPGGHRLLLEPCSRRSRTADPVVTFVGMVADGMTTAEILGDLPDPEPEDVEEALRYPAEAVRERGLPLRTPA